MRNEGGSGKASRAILSRWAGWSPPRSAPVQESRRHSTPAAAREPCAVMPPAYRRKIHGSHERGGIEGKIAEVPRRCRKHRGNASKGDIRSKEHRLKKKGQVFAIRMRGGRVKPGNAKRNRPHNGCEHHHSLHRIIKRNRCIFHVNHRREAAHCRSAALAAPASPTTATLRRSAEGIMQRPRKYAASSRPDGT